MTNASAKAKPANNTESSASSLSWIPTSSPLTESKKADHNISTILDIKFISNKLDKFGRSVNYFSCSNPEALNVIKDSIDAQGLNIEHLSLPFWQGEDCIMLRVGKQNCSLTDEVLQESTVTGIKVPVEFKYYTGKKANGYSIHV